MENPPKGSGTPENPGTLSKEHTHRDGTSGYDTYIDNEKVHITKETESAWGPDHHRDVLERTVKDYLMDDKKDEDKKQDEDK